MAHPGILRPCVGSAIPIPAVLTRSFSKPPQQPQSSYHTFPLCVPHHAPNVPPRLYTPIASHESLRTTYCSTAKPRHVSMKTSTPTVRACPLAQLTVRQAASSHSTQPTTNSRRRLVIGHFFFRLGALNGKSLPLTSSRCRRASALLNPVALVALPRATKAKSRSCLRLTIGVCFLLLHTSTSPPPLDAYPRPPEPICKIVGRGPMVAITGYNHVFLHRRPYPLV